MKRLTDKHSGREYRETDCRDWSQGFAFVYALPVKIADDISTKEMKQLQENIEKLEKMADRIKKLKKALKEANAVAPRKRRR